MNHMILIGFMGSGKSTVGRRLAKEAGLPFVDSDDLIEAQAHMKISDIFSEYGESYFRDLETLTLRQLIESEERMVIAVGGGLPMRPENREYLKQLGSVIYLSAKPETLQQRLSGDTSRPILQGGNLMEKIVTLMAERAAIYEQAADIKVITDHKRHKEIVEEIKQYV